MAVADHDSVVYNWNGLSMREDDYQYDACQAVLRAIDLEQLATYASSLNRNKNCQIEPQFAKAGRNVVRMLSFDGGERWVARFRMSATFDAAGPKYSSEDDAILVREAHCLQVVARQTSVPVPKVFDHGTSDGVFGVPYILMDCLPGSCAFDLDRFIPQHFKAMFYKQMASAQVQITNLTFPKIGTLIMNDDETMDIGPIPGIGGPFASATAYLRAWASAAKFYGTEDDVRLSCGPFADEIWKSIVEFPRSLHRLANQICGGHLDHGPFPLYHPDFGHQNMIVDIKYNVLGVINWEHATTIPWQALTLPYTVTITPPPMCPPNWYDANGQPINDDLRKKHQDIEAYIGEIERAEMELMDEPRLSGILRMQSVQNVAAAMDLYQHHGKMGFYTRVLEPFEKTALSPE